MRVVLDTNVLASAVATRGLCADVLREVLAEHALILCPQILQELRRVLVTKLGVHERLAEDVILLLQQDSQLVEPKDVPAIHLADKDDIGVLATSLSGGADLLVTGDRELLALRTIEKVRILSPRDFWNELRAQHENGGYS